MNMFTKLLETLGNNFWLIIILCLEVILAVWLLCFARGKKKNRAAEPDGHSVQDVLMRDLSKQDDEVCLLMRRSDKMPVYGGIALEVYEERTVQGFLEHLATANKNTSFKTRFKLHYAGLLYPLVCPRAKSTAYGLKVFLILQKPMAERKAPAVGFRHFAEISTN
ncbi:hypothetical protein [Hominenteromicrobium sp.]|uniref:hypothetical protein n=1 Tax=Hominenteromicrobium sp. TaxID=3073581 RepID=UPI003A8F7A18